MSANPTEKYFVRINGKIMGPFPLDRLQSLKSRGRLQPDHQVSTDRRNWRPASQLVEVFPPANVAASADLLPGLQLQSSPAPSAADSPLPAAEWFYSIDGEQHGPVAYLVLEQLVSSGAVKPDDLVWNETMTDWQPASSVPGLCGPRKIDPAQAARSAGTAAYREYQNVASGRVWNAILSSLRHSIGAGELEGFCRVLITWGGYAIALAMITGPVTLGYLAIKSDSIQVAISAIAAFFGLAVLKYIAQRMSLAAHELVSASPNRMSSTAFLDCFALLALASGVALAFVSAYAGILLDSFRSTAAGFLIGLQVLVVFVFAARVSLHPQWLNIDCSQQVRAGEEGVGIIAFLLKLMLRMATVSFGVGAITGSLGLLAAMIMIFIGGEASLNGAALAAPSASVLGGACSAPICAYFLAAIVFIRLDSAQSILLIPEKFDKLIKNKDGA